MGSRVFYIGLIGLVLVGLAFRLAVIASPLGEIDGDEAVVGLMARHIAFLGELPAFYWGQPYLGSLEAFSAALEAFRQLKAIGDMQDRLRSTASILRRDLSADHFEGARRLSDQAFWSQGTPQQGFFRIVQGQASIREGTDADLQVAAPLDAVYFLGATRATSPPAACRRG